MVDLMSNIYIAPESYRIAPDVSFSPQDYKKGITKYVSWNVYNVPLNIRIAGFPSEEEAMGFIRSRSNPPKEKGRVYSDICRCGRCGPAWDYVQVEGLIFERCRNCKMPMRHDVMQALNAPFLKDFDLDDFLNM